MDELQLHDLKNIEAGHPCKLNRHEVNTFSLPAVDVKQKARPAKHDVAIVPRPPASGKLSRRPILSGDEDGERSQVREVAVKLRRTNIIRIKIDTLWAQMVVFRNS
jgi:hypothetical protein